MGHSKKKLFKMVETMPAFPQSIHRILQLTSDINCAPKDLVRVFDHDPVLTIHLLKLVNSPYFGLSNRVSSLKQAVVVVGINTLKNLALRISPLEILSHSARSHTPIDLQVNASLHHHATTTAIIARKLARHLKVPEKEVADYFVGGLLHDFGQLVFARCYPKRFQKAIQQAVQRDTPVTVMEKHYFGLDHTELGALMGEQWQLPDHLTACMRDHHTRDIAHPTTLHDCLFTANLLANRLVSQDLDDADALEFQAILPQSIRQSCGDTLSELSQIIGNPSDEV